MAEMSVAERDAFLGQARIGVLATLDVVVTAAEYGHGKRIGVLSDYTFAVRDGEQLLNIGKAYSGLTDAEIGEMTQWFLEHTLLDEGFRRQVEPKMVLEVAFNNVMKSDRHESGYALRFPRIVRLRPDLGLRGGLHQPFWPAILAGRAACRAPRARASQLAAWP